MLNRKLGHFPRTDHQNLLFFQSVKNFLAQFNSSITDGYRSISYASFGAYFFSYKKSAMQQSVQYQCRCLTLGGGLIG